MKQPEDDSVTTLVEMEDGESSEEDLNSAEEEESRYIARKYVF